VFENVIEAMVDAVLKRFGRLDILVLNAAIREHVHFDEISFADWRRILSTNLDSVFVFTKACLPALKQAGDGRIVFRHILPNVMSHVIVSITLGIPTVVLLESFLGFLGFAVKPPLISWGLMLQDTGTFSVIGSYPWILSPVSFVLVTVFAFNALGDGLRDAIDPY